MTYFLSKPEFRRWIDRQTAIYIETAIPVDRCRYERLLWIVIVC